VARPTDFDNQAIEPIALPIVAGGLPLIAWLRRVTLSFEFVLMFT
jgi:hypothetical protein